MVQVVLDADAKGLNKGLKAGNKGLASFKKNLKVIGGALAAVSVAAVGAFVILSKRAIESADAMTKSAAAAGVSVESLSTLAFAAEQGGVGVDTLKTALGKLNKNLIDSEMGLATAREGFDLLGISITDSEGNLKSNEQVLFEAADALSQMEVGAERSAAAMKVFGKSGADLIPLLSGGADAVRELQQQARDLGLEIDSEFGKSAEEFDDNLNVLKSTFNGIINVITKELLPSLVGLTQFANEEGPEIIQWVRDFIKSVRELAPVWNFLSKTIRTVGVVIVGVIETAIARLGSIGLALFRLISGDFNLVLGELASGQEEVVSITAETASSIANIWDETTSRNQENLNLQVQANKDASAQNIANSNAETNNLINNKKKLTAAEKKKLKDELAANKKAAQEKATATQNILSAGFSFAKTAAGENANAQKAISIVEAGINTALAITKALATTANPFFAFAIGAIGAAQIAAIAAAPTFQTGGIIPGTSTTGDNVPILANSGELLLNASQQDNLAGGLGGNITIVFGDEVIVEQLERLKNTGQLGFLEVAA